MPYEPYTCLMSVYKNDNAEQLRISIESILHQTVRPSELLVVIDGMISEELDATLAEFERNNPGLFKFIRFERNRGLHVAMREGVLSASNSLILRMDADDYSRSDRAEKQLGAMAENPNLALVGCNANEFIGSPENVVAQVVLPETNEDIIAYSRRRNPFRHDAVVFRRDAVLNVGNYHDVPFFEDYDLFIRMLGNGYEACNIQEPLLSVRVSADFYMRRGGLAYIKHTAFFLNKCRNSNLMSGFDCVSTLVPRALVCIMPNGLRDLIYRRLLRTNSRKLKESLS